MFKIITDSTADLSKEYLQTNDISCVNLSYIVDGETYGRSKELPCHDFYEFEYFFELEIINKFTM